MSRPLELRVDTLVYVNGTVTADHDLTDVPISVALPSANTQPAAADFVAASLLGATETDGTWTASYRILVGTGGSLEPSTGLKDWTVKVTDSPEAPIFKAGQVRITST